MNKTGLKLFYQWESETPDEIFLRQPNGANWKTITYKEAGLEARKMAAALQKLGLAKGAHIGITSKNCYHWILADLAIMIGGFVSVPFYPSLNASQMSEVLKIGDVQALFVGKLDNWTNKAAGVPQDMAVIRFPQYDGNAVVDRGHEWNELIKEINPIEGQSHPDYEDLWTIIFTSGTTGTPKGVMHNYQNNANLVSHELTHDTLGIIRPGKARFLSFLPLNHVAERVAIEAGALMTGGSISFVENLDTFVANLKATKPTFFFAVPRIWNKFHLGVVEKVGAKKLNTLLSIPIISSIIKNKIKDQLGFSECSTYLTGASITPQHIKDWYKKLGISLREVYGMTETLGGFTVMPVNKDKANTVGITLKEADGKIDPETGEILMKAPWLMQGYYKDQEKTDEMIKDGWLYSGDKGVVDSEGYFKVIGRVKDSFKTTKGKYITPTNIEDKFSELEVLEQVCVCGLGLPQPIALAVLSDIGKKEDQANLVDKLVEDLEKVNSQLSNEERLSTLILVKDHWNESNNLLTPTLKVRRIAIHEYYESKMQAWHEDDACVLCEA